MPFKSNQQRKWAHTQNGMAALGGPKKVEEWDTASKGLELPKFAKIKNYLQKKQKKLF